uniref:DUF4283 domain-containing protein n=1 Tax=Salix viminalis TaxID=40686 RepID=A0A6N2L947_SALVM
MNKGKQSSQIPPTPLIHGLKELELLILAHDVKAVWFEKCYDYAQWRHDFSTQDKGRDESSARKKKIKNVGRQNLYTSAITPLFGYLHGLFFRLWSRNGLSLTVNLSYMMNNNYKCIMLEYTNPYQQNQSLWRLNMNESQKDVINASFLLVGRPLSYNDLTLGYKCLDYVRLCVEVDATLPFTHTFELELCKDIREFHVQYEDVRSIRFLDTHVSLQLVNKLLVMPNLVKRTLSLELPLCTTSKQISLPSSTKTRSSSRAPSIKPPSTPLSAALLVTNDDRGFTLATKNIRNSARSSLPTPSWVERVRIFYSSTRFTLDQIPSRSSEKLLKIPNNILKENTKKWTCYIVGFFHGIKLPYHSINTITTRVWSKHGLESVMTTSNGFILLCFTTEDGMHVVLERGLRMFGGRTSCCSNDILDSSLRKTKSPLFESRYGCIDCLSYSSPGRALYARVCVELDASKPYSLSPDPITIEVNYEWKPISVDPPERYTFSPIVQAWTKLGCNYGWTPCLAMNKLTKERG